MNYGSDLEENEMTATIKVKADDKKAAIAALMALINNIEKEDSESIIVKSCILNNKDCTIID